MDASRSEPLKPLADIRVIDASAYIAGPFAAMIMADLGAEVIRVEPPKGDPYRRFGPMQGDASSSFRAVNQNKTAQVADLRSEAGQAMLFELLESADIFVSNWRPAVAAEHGLTPEVVRERFPQLIWVRVSGYGQDGPRADRPAYDKILFARSGAMLPGGHGPTRTIDNTTDKITAMMAAQSATAALLARHQTGTGTICDVSMMDATSYFYGGDLSSGHRSVGQDPDLYPTSLVTFNTTFQTSDSWILLSPVSGKQLRGALAAVGRADAWDDLIAGGAATLWTRMAPVLAEVMTSRSTAEWDDIFHAADVPATPVFTFEEHLADSQIAHNETYVPVHDPAVDGSWLQVRWPARYDGHPIPSAGLPSPALPPKD